MPSLGSLRKLGRFLFLIGLFLSLRSESRADSVFVDLPSTLRTNSWLIPGFNFGIGGGGVFGYGRTRDNFLVVEPWQKGWVGHHPYLEFDLEYVFDSDWSLGVQIPIWLLTSNLDIYKQFTKNFGMGIGIGAFPRAYAVGSLYSGNGFFVSYSPAIQYLPVSSGTSETAVKSEGLTPSQFLIQQQLSFGKRFTRTEVSFLVGYAYAPGDGRMPLWDLFADSLIRHMFMAGIQSKF